MKALLAVLLLAGTLPPHAVATPVPAAASSLRDASGVQGQGLIQSASNVTDPMFGIHAKTVGLERVVRVLQWHRDAGKPGGYDQVWSSERIGPEGLDAAHANPAEFPINGQRWWSEDAKLDGHPLATDVLTAVEADADARQGWTTIKPDPAQLPPNLAVTFQPDGDLLTTSQDVAHPQVGDVRVQWRTIPGAPPPAGVRLVDGRWEMPAGNALAEASPASPIQASLPAASTTKDDAQAWIRRMFGNGTAWMVVACAVLAILVLALRRRRPTRRRR